MLVVSPKYRRPLNSNQIRILELCYKFRFISVDLLAELLGKHRSSVYEGLYVLERQGYLGKRYDKTYRLQGKPASYYLVAKGIRYLRENTGLDQTTLRNFYKNKSMRQEHVDHCLNIFRIALTIKQQTKGKFDIFTKYDLNRESFPSPLPELFLQRKRKSDKPDYVLDVFEAGTPTWLLRKRITQHEDYANDSTYQYPNVLFVAGNQNTENRLFKLTYENYADFDYFITQQDTLLDSEEGKVWIDVKNSEEDEVIRVNLYHSHIRS